MNMISNYHRIQWTQLHTCESTDYVRRTPKEGPKMNLVSSGYGIANNSTISRQAQNDFVATSQPGWRSLLGKCLQSRLHLVLSVEIRSFRFDTSHGRCEAPTALSSGYHGYWLPTFRSNVLPSSERVKESMSVVWQLTTPKPATHFYLKLSHLSRCRCRRLVIVAHDHWHTHTHTLDSSGRGIGPSQRPLPATTHNNHKRQASMPAAGCEHACGHRTRQKLLFLNGRTYCGAVCVEWRERKQGRTEERRFYRGIYLDGLRKITSNLLQLPPPPTQAYRLTG
jgi:hypothetical protein